ncbi:MAG TPA: copper-binding protein [Ramlibacter sp.]|nr:copper-binding protein [Ramlibacter sp.]
MKLRTCTTFLATMIATISVFAQTHMGDMKGMDMSTKPVAETKQQTHTAAGTVKKADPKAGKVTLQHGPVASLNWPAMTMAFKVRDKALWPRLEEGKKVEIEFTKQGADYVVTGVK